MQPENLEVLEHLYEQYKQKAENLDPSWQTYFKAIDGLDLAISLSRQQKAVSTTLTKSSDNGRITNLIDAYRRFGHLLVNANPIALREIVEPLELRLDTLGFNSDELSLVFPTHGILAKEEAPLDTIIEALRKIYCNTIGYEFKNFRGPAFDTWFEERIEKALFSLSLEQKLAILKNLNQSELFESFLHTKYVGQKRFSLEGCETLIPMLTALLEKGGELEITEVVLGMSHRGRLNVLTNILHKPYHDLFAEFYEDHIPEASKGLGDVKYHKGHTSESFVTQAGKTLKIFLSPNPSHLESVDAVVEGFARSKQTLKGDKGKNSILPVLIHGDAALAGQGVVYETLQLYGLPDYSTGGTIHFVINNQIGFTTAPRQARSTLYCTDIAHTFGFPVFHVNAEDPEGCVKATLLALDIRQKFQCDVFIDINCYRKYGHNESDEPAFTQPLEYKLIKQKQSIRDLYHDALVQQESVAKDQIESLENDFKQHLQEIHSEVKKKMDENSNEKEFEIASLSSIFDPVPTGVKLDTLKQISKRLCEIPSGFDLHPKLVNLVKERESMVNGERAVDWGTAETLAYATLLWEGKQLRLAGQDSGRGTFSHRHAIWMNQTKEESYVPLAHLKEGQGKCEIINSPLSEMAALAFEYGYSLTDRPGLFIWEAQFGDFVNSAQVIIDQYIVSGEQKWGQTSNLTLFLPHGYEGQGPEHSSGRLERFLALTGHDNIQVANPTTPAQFFHLLRRQGIRELHKPLIVFTPKGLLRHPKCISSVSDLTEGSFQEILDDPQAPVEPKSILFCSGRIYYDLLARREERKAVSSVIVRIEQLYPFHAERIEHILKHYPTLEEFTWVQEEPQNMGAWHFIRSHLETVIPTGHFLKYVGRATSATPAAGLHIYHKQEYNKILNQVFPL